MMHIVTPSHSKEVEDSVNMENGRSEERRTTHNRFLDALLLEGRALTIAEWQELSSSEGKVCHFVCKMNLSSFRFLPHFSSLFSAKVLDLPMENSVISSTIKENVSEDRPLFRYIGMIQDMLETEYFSVNDAMPKHYGSLHPFASDATLKLAERTPMLLMSIPHTTDIPTQCTNRSNVNDNECDHHLSKRVRYDDSDFPPSSTEKSEPTVAPEVVAQFYLEQYPIHDTSGNSDATSRPSVPSLKLNQVVEILGVLQEGTVATDPNDDDMAVDENHPSRHSNNDMDGMGNQGSSMMLLEDQETTVIPSHIPRLHVLWYRTLFIDDEDEENEAMATLTSPSTAEPIFHAWSKVGLTNSGVKDNDPTLGGWNAVAQAVWLLLHSQAERDPTTGIVRSAPHHASTLGCLSLNLLFPNADDEPVGDNHCDVAEFISFTMKRLVPHCHILTFSSNHATASMGTPLTAIQAPHKICGRLRSTALQQPAGTMLIVDVRNWKAESSNDIHREDADHPFHSLRQICRHHMLQYIFEGGMQIPFEADYRVLVLSNAMTQHLVPCTSTMQLPSSCVGNLKRDWSTLLDPLLIPIRADLQRNRSYCANRIIHLDDSVIESSQQEFCERRRRSRDTKCAKINTGVKELVDEADFHRWLTLCRVHAKSRRSNVAEKVDWDESLKLDDSMVYSLKKT
jgi:Mini-chromosome maintenance replisome factor